MRYRRIPDSDSLFRHCIYPVSFKKKTFSSDKLWHLEVDELTGILHGSLAWERYVPAKKYVHEYGCRIESRRNSRRKAGTPSVYCGAYRLNGVAVRALNCLIESVSSADVVHQVEDCEIAHVALRIGLKPEGPNVEFTKTEILVSLWNACYGPLTYKDVWHQDIKPHPCSNLSTGPAGQYSDTRSYLYRLWSLIRFRICLIRFRIYSWVWRSLSQNWAK